MIEDAGGKFVLLVARGSAERVHADGSITGLPYLWARLWGEGPPATHPILQGMLLETTTSNRWHTISGVFAMPKGVHAMDVMLAQAEASGRPQTGSAARVKNVEVRFFDTETAARAYVSTYTAAHEPPAEYRTPR